MDTAPGMANARDPVIFPPSCSIVFIILQLLSCSVPAKGKADFSVCGPGKTVLAVLGENVELPCHLSLNISAKDMELRWYRDQPSQVVHLHKNGTDLKEEQMREYQGRTTFLSARLDQGKATVKIHNVTVFDNGTFHCNFKDGTVSAEARLLLTVAAPLSRSFPSMAWRIVLPLILTMAGLATVGATCLFQKCQKDRNMVQLEEATLYRAEKQHSQVSPSLDPDTASPKLALSEDGKSVRRLFFDQELPDVPSRFDQDPCVLAREQFSAGRYYWEVQVGHRKAWNVGVCLESLDRKGRIPKAPQHGLWALELYKKTFWALAFPRVRLHPPEPLHQVGILLDCDAGTVSFYNVDNGSLIYTFSGLSFSEPLRPFFCLWTHDPTPLIIYSDCQPPEAVSSPQSQVPESMRTLLQQDP
ncbi:butyrophilin subfamily 1 member A1-like isoform X3 [Ursus americanus]|uniref:butyrophilin subfamily 1 member A1-like isoform X3 n=1 Tax=Ursus americanus TaxID=9643 RepID=UPI001E67B20B|nr:butyrophilin subfamily 1 member A1-like isoform X3 [Ursus americanus]